MRRLRPVLPLTLAPLSILLAIFGEATVGCPMSQQKLCARSSVAHAVSSLWGVRTMLRVEWSLPDRLFRTILPILLCTRALTGKWQPLPCGSFAVLDVSFRGGSYRGIHLIPPLHPTSLSATTVTTTPFVLESPPTWSLASGSCLVAGILLAQCEVSRDPTSDGPLEFAVFVFDEAHVYTTEH